MNIENFIEFCNNQYIAIESTDANDQFLSFDKKGYPMLKMKFKGKPIYVYNGEDKLKQNALKKDVNMVLSVLSKNYNNIEKSCFEKAQKKIGSAQLKLVSVSISPIIEESGLVMYYTQLSYSNNFKITLDIKQNQFFDVKWTMS